MNDKYEIIEDSDDIPSNPTNNPCIDDLINARFSRRGFFKGLMATSAVVGAAADGRDSPLGGTTSGVPEERERVARVLQSLFDLSEGRRRAAGGVGEAWREALDMQSLNEDTVTNDATVMYGRAILLEDIPRALGPTVNHGELLLPFFQRLFPAVNGYPRVVSANSYSKEKYDWAESYRRFVLFNDRRRECPTYSRAAWLTTVTAHGTRSGRGLRGGDRAARPRPGPMPHSAARPCACSRSPPRTTTTPRPAPAAPAAASCP